MMNFELYKEVVKEKILEYLPEEYHNAEVSVREVPKVNRTLTGLTVAMPEKTNITPTIYLENKYEEYQSTGDLEQSLCDIADAVKEGMNRVPEKVPDMNLDTIRENVILVLINATQNEEMLKNVPNRSFQDLSVIYRWVVSNDEHGMGTVIITDDIAKQVGMNEEELFRCAVENTKRICPPKICSMNEILGQLMVEEGMSQDMLETMGMLPENNPKESMWIITNQSGINGAASMLYEDNLHKLAENVGTDLYVLPSSIHEVIAVSVEMGRPEELAQLVHEVNCNAVELGERLSNNVYHYDKDLRKLELATDVPEKRLDGVVAEVPMQYEQKGPSR